MEADAHGMGKEDVSEAMNKKSKEIRNSEHFISFALELWVDINGLYRCGKDMLLRG